MSPSRDSMYKRGILAVDDEPEIVEIIKQALEDEGYKVFTASNPSDGLKVYEQSWREIDLVLLDYLMPEMTGDLVFECLQRINPDVRVVLLTACDDVVAKRMFENGLRGYVQKPFYLGDLILRVQEEVDPI